MILNETGIIGVALYSFTNDVTGSFFLTLLTILIFLIALCLLFRIPIEFTSLIVLPMLLVFMSIDGQFLAVVGCALIYMGVLFGRYFFVNFK